jgi:hypothetical protein
MNLTALSALFVLMAACGGETSLGGDAEAARSLPAPDSGACQPTAAQPESGHCNLCSDELWHCLATPQGLPQCPAGISACSKGMNCVTCGDSESAGIECLSPGGVALVQLDVSCLN